MCGGGASKRKGMPRVVLCPATSHTCSAICRALLYWALTCLITSSGTPQVAAFSSRPFTILVSEAMNTLNRFADLVRGRLPAARLGQHLAVLLRLVPNRYELLTGGRRALPLLRESGPKRQNSEPQNQRKTPSERHRENPSARDSTRSILV
jgi:hypothetical protein